MAGKKNNGVVAVISDLTKLQETFKQKHNAGSYVLPDFRNRNFYKFCTG